MPIMMLVGFVFLAGGFSLWAFGAARKANVMQIAEDHVFESALPLSSLFLDDWYKCSGCDCHYKRHTDGYVRIGEGFEFCSMQCYSEPVPFQAIEIRRS